MRRGCLVFFVSVLTLSGSSQAVVNPVFGLISHETMSVESIEFYESSTVINMTVVNKVAAGYFCVDRSTYLILPDGKRFRMQKAEGIPYCPDIHRFRHIGETISFRLHFQGLSGKPEWFDLVEDCSDNCFSVYGITIDPVLNREIERAYSLADSGNPGDAAAIFREQLARLDGVNHGITGSLYTSIVIMSLRDGNEAEAKMWYEKMSESGAPHLELYIRNLAERGIKW